MRILSVARILIVAFVSVLLTACVTVAGVDVLERVSLDVEDDPAAPNALASIDAAGPVASRDAWTNERAPLLIEAFQRDLYGYWPDAFEVSVVETQRLVEDAYDGAATIDITFLKISTRFGDAEPVERNMRVVIAKPTSATGPVPTILKMDACPTFRVFRIDNVLNESTDACRVKGLSPINRAVNYSLGRYHVSPPIEEMVKRGYAYASISAGDYVPDNRSLSRTVLDDLSKGADENKAWGALAAWAFQFARAVDHLDADPDLDPSRTAVYGHSRYGKAALIASAFDPRIDAVIAHQSGRFGAALTMSAIGEPVSELIATYPDWLSTSYVTRALEGEIETAFDQHHLIALSAPRPVLLGHGRRDIWSDPNGAFRAAQGATPVYELFGSDGLSAARLDDFRPDDDIAFWIRPGTHGETEEDWPAFFDFLGAHFAPSAPIK
ncbi:MAG: hypothetical protein AAGJ87_11335 [Pseudomonadota bacterium]